MNRIIKTAIVSLLFNMAYGIYDFIIGAASGSWWLITISCYYIILGVMRFAVLRVERTDYALEIFIERFTGIMFVILSVVLGGTVCLAVVNDHGVRYNQIIMITIALYSFTKITLAIINLVKARKGDSPIIKTLRNISLADAVVSIFSLQRSMLVTFEGMTLQSVRLFNLLTGICVCMVVLLLGLNLIGGGKIGMAKSKIVETNQKIAEKVTVGYKKIETAVVKGYTKIEDRFVDKYLTRDGETVKEAKERLNKKSSLP